jgi:hypothetical protein
MAETTTAAPEATMPAFIRAGMDFFTGKTVLKTTFDETAKALEAANARIAELEKIDTKALGERILKLEYEGQAKDATIKDRDTEITRLSENFKSAARQAQEQLARAGAATPPVVEAPKHPSGEKPAAEQFVEKFNAKVSGGMKKSDALAACVREFPALHVEFIKSGNKLS